jgi:prepilin peptidase CpaA
VCLGGGVPARFASMMLQLSLCIFLAACFIASYTDVRWRRVPNVLTYGCLAAILALSAPRGLIPFGVTAGSAIIVLLVGSFIFGLGWLGGGDIKLLATGAAAIGFPSFLVVLLYVATVGGIIGAVYALRERRLRTIVTSIALSAVGGTAIAPAAASRRVPYALAICAGACFYAASESFAPWLRFVH